MYYGRGPLRLTGNKMYGMFGKAMDDTEHMDPEYSLLFNPDHVLDDSFVYILSAVWFYMTPFPPAPSLHDIMVKNYVPNSSELAKGFGANYAATIVAVDGANGCGNPTEP